jgi:hypothetical protein
LNSQPPALPALTIFERGSKRGNLSRRFGADWTIVQLQRLTSAPHKHDAGRSRPRMQMMVPVQTAFATSPYQEQNQELGIAQDRSLQGMRDITGWRMIVKCL